VTASYWDVVTSGQSGSPGGGQPSPPAALKGVIPADFDRTVWGIDPYTNNGYPYLLWEVSHGVDYRVYGTSATVGVPLNAIPSYGGVNNKHGDFTYSGGTQFVGEYLGCAANDGYLRQSPDAQRIKDQSLKIVSLYEVAESKHSKHFTSSNGTTDVQNAIRAAHAAGQPAGSAIYFAVDFDPAPAQLPRSQKQIQADLDAIDKYFRAIRAGISGSGYKLGAYAAGVVLSAFAADPFGIAIEYTWFPSASFTRRKFTGEDINQVYADKPYEPIYVVDPKTNLKVQVDLDIAHAPDFGQWIPIPGSVSGCK
jgi:Domain of unknown function (DUF1906)